MLSYYLKIDLRPFEHIGGFRAIDKRRALGLEDHDSFKPPWGKYNLLTAIVDEPFARRWFGNDTNHHIEINVDLLTRGEIIDVGSTHCGSIDIHPDLPADRIKDLYIRARFAELERALAEAKATAKDEEEESNDD